MAIVFPASPSVNDTFTAGSITYKWDGDKWIGLGVTPADRLVEGSNSLEITASNELQWTGGNVGIKTNPSKQLHIHDTTSSCAVLVSGTAPQIRFNSDAADGVDGERGIVGLATGAGQFMANAVSGDLVIRSESGNSILFGNSTTERVRILSNGELVVKGPSNPADYTLSDGIFVQPANGLSGLTITSGSATNNAYINFSGGTASNAEQFAFAIGRLGSTGTGIVKISDGNVAEFTSNGIAFPSGKGIDFSANANAAGMTSELLDDYEEGTWLPVIQNTSVAPTYNNQVGRYTRIGRVVYAQGFVQTAGGATYLNNNERLFINGLPYARSSTNAVGYVAAQGHVQAQSFNFDGSNNDYGVTGQVGVGFAQSITGGESGVMFYVTASGGIRGTVRNAANAGNGFIIEFNLMYIAD